MSGINLKDECFYCGALVSARNKGDHYPIPARNGGNVTVPCCQSCHDMKDRFLLEDWPIEWIEVVISDIPNMQRETRIFLAKIISLFSDAKYLLHCSRMKQKRFKGNRA